MLPPKNLLGLGNVISSVCRRTFSVKYVQLFILPISSVVGNKVQCLRKKRPVTPSESDDYGIILKIKEILTQEDHYMAKNVSTIPRFSPLRRSRVLAFYRVQKKNKRLLAVKTLMTPFQ